MALQVVRMHPAGFKPVFPDRWINNIYFDDDAFTALYENFAGVAHRRKVRLRWYGSVFPEEQQNARLEWKTRSNQLGNKWVKQLSAMDFSTIATLRSQIQPVWPEIDVHRPVLLNRYQRSYFAAAGGQVRLTVDWKLGFAEPDAAFQTKRLHHVMPGGVIELKYHPEEEDYASWIMQHMPFPVTKNSKYVAGLLALRR